MQSSAWSFIAVYRLKSRYDIIAQAFAYKIYKDIAVYNILVYSLVQSLGKLFEFVLNLGCMQGFGFGKMLIHFGDSGIIDLTGKRLIVADQLLFLGQCRAQGRFYVYCFQSCSPPSSDKVVEFKEVLPKKKFGINGSLTPLSASIIAWRSYNHVWWL